MKRMILTLLTLALVSLACGQIVKPAQVPNALGTPFGIPNATRTEAVPTATPIRATQGSGFATVVNAVVNVREAPDNTSAVVAYLVAGAAVDVLDCAGPWCQIRDPAGYVWRGCLSDNPDGLRCEAKP